MAKKNEWAYSWEKPRLWIIDARAFLILLVSALYWAWWLLLICLTVIGVLFYIERRKRMSIESALRFIVSSFVTLMQGRRVPVCPLASRNFFIDRHDLEVSEPDRHFAPVIEGIPDLVEYARVNRIEEARAGKMKSGQKERSEN